MAAITSSIIAVGTAGYQIVNSEKQRSDAKKAIDDFDRQELKNPAEGIRISTLKSDQQTDANNSNFATAVDALQRGGTRAVLGGLPRLNEANILLQNTISQDLSDQDARRSVLIAQGEAQLIDLQEKREINAIQGLGQQEQTARQDTINAIGNFVSGSLALGSAIKSKKDSDNDDESGSGESIGANGVGVNNAIRSPLGTGEIFNTNGTVIGSTFNEQPAFTVENPFLNKNIGGSDNTSLFFNNPLLFNS